MTDEQRIKELEQKVGLMGVVMTQVALITDMNLDLLTNFVEIVEPTLSGSQKEDLERVVETYVKTVEDLHKGFDKCIQELV